MNKLYSKNDMVKITLQKVSDLLGNKCENIMDWMQPKYPMAFRRLVTDIEFDKKFKVVTKKELGEMLHSYYNEWKKLKNEFDFI